MLLESLQSLQTVIASAMIVAVLTCVVEREPPTVIDVRSPVVTLGFETDHDLKQTPTPFLSEPVSAIQHEAQATVM